MFRVLVQARLRSETSRYYLNFVWWVIEPLLMLAVFYLVFGVLLQRGKPGFVDFLIVGVVVWGWFQRSVANSTQSLVVGKGLMLQVYFPKILLPMAAVAQDGFRRMTARIKAVWEEHPQDATQGFLEACVAYVEFARESPTHYRLMFGPEVSDYGAHPELAATAKAAFDGMVSIVQQYLEENALDSSSPIRLAHAAWAMAHGLSMLAIDGRIRACDDIEALVRFAFQTLLKGVET